jgi:hypothetical protein
MMAKRIVGLLCCVFSCVPVWIGLGALQRADYLAAVLALALAHVLARTGLELNGFESHGAE